MESAKVMEYMERQGHLKMFTTFTVLYILPHISLRCHTEQLM